MPLEPGMTTVEGLWREWTVGPRGQALRQRAGMPLAGTSSMDSQKEATWVLAYAMHRRLDVKANISSVFEKLPEVRESNHKISRRPQVPRILAAFYMRRGARLLNQPETLLILL